MSEINFGLKISTFKINININKDEKSSKKALSAVYKNETKLNEINRLKEKQAIDYHLAGCRF